MRYFNNWEAMKKLLALLAGGMGNTLTIFGWTLLLSLPLGLLIATGRMSRSPLIRKPISLYILIMRGTPLILQIFAIHFLLPSLFKIRPDRMMSTITAFTLNYAAYFAEIFRGGILAMERGQYEAAQVLGFTKVQCFFRIILPQVVKRILLPTSNEVITLVKDTALATVIAVSELYRAATNEASRTASVEPLIVAGIFYLLMNAVITKVFDVMIKRFDYYKS